jgi:acyl carrier protein
VTPEAIITAVTDIVSEQVDMAHHGGEELPIIYGNVSLSDFGLDDLSAVEILMHVEESFGIELADDDVTLSSTVDGIAKLVAWHLRNKEHSIAIAAPVREAWRSFPKE